MIGPSKSISDSGSFLWIAQRVSGLLVFFYFLFILGILVSVQEVTYEYWKSIFNNRLVQVFSLLAIVSLITHAWIGIQCVISDYITERLIGPKAILIRRTVSNFFGLLLMFYLFWSLLILWNL